MLGASEARAGVGLDSAAAVDAVLAAPDHYAAVGLSSPCFSSPAEIRSRYLRQSVLVHPGKNPHPQATRAFQRVTEAWSVLGDEDAKRRYDEELRVRPAPFSSFRGRENSTEHSTTTG